MHPSERDTSEIYRDVIDMEIPDRYDPRATRFVKSIAFGTSDIIFSQSYSCWSKFDVDGRNLQKSEISIQVPLMNEAGLIISKLESSRVRKRTRDAFDMYFLLSGPKATECIKKIASISQRHNIIKKALEDYIGWLEFEEKRFNSNVSLHAKAQINNAADLVGNCIRKTVA